MARFLLSALGSAGDVHPFVVVASALLARGHDVRLIAPPHFEARIRAAGVPFAPIGAPGDYERLLQNAELWEPRRGARFIIDELLARLPEAYAASAALSEDPETVLVGSTLSWGMRLVQDARGLRGATLHLSPVCVPSSIAPPVLPGIGDLSSLPAWAVRMLQRTGEHLVLDRWIAPRLNRFRATLGLRPVTRVWSRWMHSPDLVIGAWPDWFAPAQRDWPSQAVTSGFPVFDEGGAKLDDALAAFLEAGPAPIGITAGSAMAHGKAFFARALDACRAAGHRAVLVTAFTDDLPDMLPAPAHAVAYAPFSALLPRLAALIHHGGIGTSAQCLAAGIPQFVAPFAHDQFDNAARLARLGVSTTLDRSASRDPWIAAIRARVDAGEGSDAVRSCADRMAAAEPAGILIARRLEELAYRPHGRTSRNEEEP